MHHQSNEHNASIIGTVFVHWLSEKLKVCILLLYDTEWDIEKIRFIAICEGLILELGDIPVLLVICNI